MPWDITIRTHDQLPLGSREYVKACIAAAFPGTEFSWDISGPEKLAYMDGKGMEVPDVIRKSFEQSPSMEQGDYEGKDFSVRFHLGAESTIIDSVEAEVRGETRRAMPLLSRLTLNKHWVIAECGNDKHFLPR